MKESHCRVVFAACLLALLAVVPAALLAQSSMEDYHARYGRADMNISCTDAAKAPFERGLLQMHSFAWPESRQSFQETAKADPNCAMAYWGIAMSYYDSLHDPPSDKEVAAARAALDKADAAPTATERERAYVAAARLIYRGYPNVSRRDRDRAYNQALGEIHRKYPNDDEAAVFFALSKLALARRGVENANDLEIEAADSLEPLFQKLPSHPGVAHYLIHAYDDLGDREKGRAAALRYSKIAPVLTHAQHMPSHIFAGLGMWKESNLSNEKALEARPTYYHSLMYLVYGHMEMGQRAKARQLVDELRAVATSPKGTNAARRGLHSVNTWLLLESHDWAAAAQAEEYSSNPRDRAETLYVRAVGAARSGNAELAQRVLILLHNAIADLGREKESGGVAARYDALLIQEKEVEAAIRLDEGRGDEAVATMREAVKMADAPGVSWAPPDSGTGLPAHEFFGEVLMELGRYQEAQKEFTISIERTPNRLYSVYGLAKSSALAGDNETAEKQFKALSTLLANADPGLPEAAEAKQYLSRYQTARAGQ